MVCLNCSLPKSGSAAGDVNVHVAVERPRKQRTTVGKCTMCTAHGCKLVS